MIEETLNEFQKRRITERIKLNFDEELKKSKDLFERKRFSKNLRNHLDIFISELYNDGIMFYNFTIFMPFTKKEDPKMWYYTHLRVEDLINYIKEKIEMVEFCYISIELQKKKNIYNDEAFEGIPYFNGILGVRSLIGRNKFHFNEIKKIFNIQLNDTIIKKLSSIKTIKKCWDSVIKENNYKFHRFAQYSNYYDDLYAEIADFESQYDSVDHIAFGLDEHLDSLNSNLCGIKDLNPYSQTIVNYLLTIYMDSKNFCLNENRLFKKLHNTTYSWTNFSSIEYLQRNNINIFNDLKKIYPQQLGKLKIHKLFIEGWDFFFSEVKKNNHYPPIININNDAIEFKDGLYFFSKNKFLKKNNEDLNCRYFVAKKFDSVKKNLPKKWLNQVIKTLSPQFMQNFCSFIGEYFNSVKTFDKKNSKIFIGNKNLIKKENILHIKITANKDLDNLSLDHIQYEKAFIRNWHFLPIEIHFVNGLNDSFMEDKVWINRVIIYIFSRILFSKNIKSNLINISENELIKIMIFCNNSFFSRKIK